MANSLMSSESDEIGPAGFLEGHDSRALKTLVSLEVQSNLTDQTLEGQLAASHSVFLMAAVL